LNIIAVDDSEVLLEYVTMILESGAHTIHRAGSADAALQVISTTAVDLVLTDVYMAGMDGFMLVKTLRETPEYQELPIIFVTGDDSEDFKMKCRKAGASGWLKKPFKPNQLLDLVRGFEL
jgi:two-component system, chemotaxis family, chemotaxis protein CheY